MAKTSFKPILIFIHSIIAYEKGKELYTFLFSFLSLLSFEVHKDGCLHVDLEASLRIFITSSSFPCHLLTRALSFPISNLDSL